MTSIARFEDNPFMVRVNGDNYVIVSGGDLLSPMIQYLILERDPKGKILDSTGENSFKIIQGIKIRPAPGENPTNDEIKFLVTTTADFDRNDIGDNKLFAACEFVTVDNKEKLKVMDFRPEVRIVG